MISSAQLITCDSTFKDRECIYTCKSDFSVTQTIKRLETMIKKMGISISSVFNYNNHEKDTNLESTEVIIINSRPTETDLVKLNQTISIKLPLKIAVWEDIEGYVWMEFKKID